jgi:hypothetical protein
LFRSTNDVLADAATLANVIENGDDLVGRQQGAFEGGALAFGGCFLAGAAVDHVDPLVATAPSAEINVAVAAFVMVGAGGIVAEAMLDGEAGWFGHGAEYLDESTRSGTIPSIRILYRLFAGQAHHQKV